MTEREPGANENLFGAALAAQEWFVAQVQERSLTLPAGFPGMKNMIMQLTLTEQHRGRTPQQLAEGYLANLERKQGRA